MKTLHKVVPCIIRDNDGVKEILAFIHPPPLSDKQIVKGTVERNEKLEPAALRELFEETGLSNCQIDKSLGSFETICHGGPNRDLDLERLIWNVFIIHSNDKLPDCWTHRVTGDGIDEGISFEFFWYPFLQNNHTGFHEDFITLFEFLKKKMV